MPEDIFWYRGGLKDLVTPSYREYLGTAIMGGSSGRDSVT